MSFVAGCYASSMFFTAFYGKLAHDMQSKELESPVGMMPLPLPLPHPVHEEDSIGLVGAKNPSHWGAKTLVNWGTEGYIGQHMHFRP